MGLPQAVSGILRWELTTALLVADAASVGRRGRWQRPPRYAVDDAHATSRSRAIDSLHPVVWNLTSIHLVPRRASWWPPVRPSWMARLYPPRVSFPRPSSLRVLPRTSFPPSCPPLLPYSPLSCFLPASSPLLSRISQGLPRRRRVECLGRARRRPIFRQSPRTVSRLLWHRRGAPWARDRRRSAPRSRGPVCLDPGTP